jgi:hypothetical protein
MIKEGGNIRFWDQEVLADAVVQYTQLALQLANLTARNQASLVQTPVKKKTPTGGKVGRPRATEKIAKTNTKLDDFYRRKPTQSDAAMPAQEEIVRSQRQKKQPAEKKKEQPAERKEPEEEKKKQHAGCLRPQTFEEPPHDSVSLLTVNKADTILQRVQMAINLRDSKRKEQ